MTRLQQLHNEFDQSPWLDNLSRDRLTDGTIQRFIDGGIRGITANPSIFAHAITGSDAYDADFHRLLDADTSLEDAYWDLITTDIAHALELFHPLYESSGGGDGFVSIEVSPTIANDTAATIDAARDLHKRIDRPNLLVKIPATDAGIPAIEAMTSEGRSINITLIFSLERYGQVIDAYMSGLETLLSAQGDLTRVHSVASFFVSRVDTEVDRRLEAMGTSEGMGLRGKAAVAQAKLAYQQFRTRFADERWKKLADAGANLQRPLWASTSTKNPDYPDTMYVDELIGPDTVNTLPEATIEAFEDHGTLAHTIDKGHEDASETLDRLHKVGIDLLEVASVLETQGVNRFAADQDSVLAALKSKLA
ncbi:MAG: transaldolase [Acidimicrobiia bacterium]|nr:transaldolase [Acidimicrobiia bacterium]